MVAKQQADKGNGKPIIFGEFGWAEQGIAQNGLVYGMQQRNRDYDKILRNGYDINNDGVDNNDPDGFLVWNLTAQQDAFPTPDPVYYNLHYYPAPPTEYSKQMGQTLDILKYWVEKYKGNNPTVPAVPTGLTGTACNKGIMLHWNAVSGATEYNINRCNTSNGIYETIAYGVTGTSFLDPTASNGTTYYYKINAERNDTGGISADSSYAALSASDTDYMWNFDCMYSHTSNLGFDSSNSSYFEGDTSRLFRPNPGAQNQSIVYHRNDQFIGGFQFYTYYWTGESVQNFTFYTSPDGTTWTQWIPARINYGGTWTKFVFLSDATHVIPNGTLYIKAVFPNNPTYWTPQVASAQQSLYGLSIDDNLNDWSKTYSHTTGSYGVDFDSSSPQYFDGDSSRVCRSGTPDGTTIPAYPRANIVYKLSDMRHVKVTSYYWPSEPLYDLIMETSADGISFTPYAPDRTITSGAWEKRVYETYNLPCNTNYLRIYLSIGGIHPWNPQISRVEINN